MKKYFAFFRMRLVTGLQYRAAAAAGLVTQFVWGAMEILLYRAFYESNPGAFPMEFEALSSYIWLRQAFLVMCMMWVFENDIFQTITDGGVVYELCRPLDLYTMWFVRTLSNRASKAALRFLPILIFAAFLPKPYGMSAPVSIEHFFCFIVSFFLSFLNVSAFTMLIYISAFYTLQTTGIKVLCASLTEFLAGDTIPLPFLPDGMRRVVELLPFASMQNVPFRIYGGDLGGSEMYARILLQLFWCVVMIGAGKLLTRNALRRVVVQGG